MIELCGTLTLREVVQFQFAHMFRHAWVFAYFIAPICGIGALLALWTTYGATQGAADGLPPQFLRTVVFPLAIVVIGVFVVPYWGAKRQYVAAEYFRHPITYSFDECGIRTEAKGTSAQSAWTLLEAVRETRCLFVVYHGPGIAFIVPKRFFRDAEQIEQWRYLVCTATSFKRIDRVAIVGRFC